MSLRDERKGILYGIGVGPGDPELMTVKAINCMKECQVVILPHAQKEKCIAYQIVKEMIPEIEEKECLTIDFPMTKDESLLRKAQNQAAEQIASCLDQGKKVAFLTIGDPSVYSTFQYVNNRIKDRGYEVLVIPGVTSFCAAAARLGISLGDKEDEIHIIPGSYPLEGSLDLPGTKIYMKSGKRLQSLLSYIKAKQKEKELEIYAISNCGMKNEVVSQKIDEIDIGDGYLTLIIVKNK